MTRIDLTPLTTVVVDGLAAHRLTRLVTADVITQPLRDRALVWAWRDQADYVLTRYNATGWDEAKIVRQLDQLPEGAIQKLMQAQLLVDPPKLATLITCRWCAGVYVAAAVVGLSAARVPGWRTAMRVAATASCAALLAAPEDDQ